MLLIKQKDYDAVRGFAKKHGFEVYIGKRPEIDEDSRQECLYFHRKGYRYKREIEDELAGLSLKIEDLAIIISPIIPKNARKINFP